MKLLTLVLASCLTTAAFAAESAQLPDDVVGLSYLTNGKILEVRDVTKPLPAACLRPNGPMCHPPRPEKEITIQYTLPGCADELGSVTVSPMYSNLPVNRETLAVSAVAIHRELSQRIRCFAPNTQIVKIVRPGSTDMITDLAQMGSELPVFTKLPERPDTLEQSDEIEIEKVEDATPPGTNVIRPVPITRVTLKVFKGNCTSKLMNVATIANGVHVVDANGIGRWKTRLLVSAPVVTSELRRSAFCPAVPAVEHVTVDLRGIISPQSLEVVPLK